MWKWMTWVISIKNIIKSLYICWNDFFQVIQVLKLKKRQMMRVFDNRAIPAMQQ
jgi:hypothetical protein